MGKNTPKSSKPSAPNVLTGTYVDSANAKEACKKTKKLIEEKCKPHSEDESKKEKANKGSTKSLTKKLAKATEGLDALGKVGYVRTKDNAWQEDHCSGLWLSVADIKDPNYATQVQEMMTKLENEQMSMIKDALGGMVEAALKNPKVKDAVFKKMAWLGARTAGKAVAGILGGIFTGGVATAASVAWTVADVVQTASEIATLVGPEAQMMFDSMNDMVGMKDKAKSILGDMKDHPEKAHANMQEMLASFNPCLKARKCGLVKYKDSETGKDGCCRGQTGHHIIPDSMVKNAGCPGYKYEEAPVMCLEGTSNLKGWGSHGTAHQILKTSMDEYKADTGSETISYKDAKKQALDAAEKAGAKRCDRKCLEAQLDEHYKCDGKDLKATAGTGGRPKKSTVTPPPTPTPKASPTQVKR